MPRIARFEPPDLRGADSPLRLLVGGLVVVITLLCIALAWGLLSSTHSSVTRLPESQARESSVRAGKGRFGGQPAEDEGQTGFRSLRLRTAGG